VIISKKFEDIHIVIRSHNLKKERQYIGYEKDKQ